MPALASTIATLPLAPWVTVVMVRVGFSKLSLASTLVMTLPSSVTVSLSSWMSATGVPVMSIVPLLALKPLKARVAMLKLLL